MTTKAFAENILENIRKLHHGNQKEEKFSAFSPVSSKFQAQKRRCITDKIDAHQQTPLNLRGAGQEILAVAGDHNANRYQQVGVDRNENREETVPANANQKILQGSDDEKSPEEGAVIRPLRWREGNVFPQRQKRNRGKKEE